MAMKSTQNQYGNVAVTIHWLSAIGIVALLGSGFRAANTVDPGAKAQILSVHAPLAIAILLLTLSRIAWWWLADNKPAPVAGSPKWQDRGARAVHFAFYVVIVGMAASGIGMFLLSGAGEILFGGGTGALPDFGTYKPRVPHGLGARLLVALLILHAGAALHHHFIRKDGSLWRMWLGRAVWRTLGPFYRTIGNRPN
ncbi:MAG: cytochrome b/b6 domain-containing protein [Hyphomicrobiales bacterium]|nr:cytochrome b/b6 domain-containing protein [Hyphomicrobiales bacterium]